MKLTKTLATLYLITSLLHCCKTLQIFFKPFYNRSRIPTDPSTPTAKVTHITDRQRDEHCHRRRPGSHTLQTDRETNVAIDDGEGHTHYRQTERRTLSSTTARETHYRQTERRTLPSTVTTAECIVRTHQRSQ